MSYPVVLHCVVCHDVRRVKAFITIAGKGICGPACFHKWWGR